MKKILSYTLILIFAFINSACAEEIKLPNSKTNKYSLKEIILDTESNSYVPEKIIPEKNVSVFDKNASELDSSPVMDEAIMVSDPSIMPNQNKKGIFLISNIKGGVEKYAPKEEFIKNAVDDWFEGNYATGMWGGARPFFESHGLTLRSSILYSPFSKIGGGPTDTSNGRGYTMQHLSVSLDTEKAGLWKGGTFFALYQRKIGSGINGAVGSPIDGWDFPDEMSRIQEYWYQQKLFNNKIRLKVGKQCSSNEFGMIYSGTDFMNLRLAVIPTVPYAGFPYPGFGFMAEVNPTSWLSIKEGIYSKDGNPLNIVGIEVKAKIKNMPGRYMLGSWQMSNSNGIRTIESYSPSGSSYNNFNRNYGVYASFEQMVYKEKKEIPQDRQGIMLFGQLGISPSEKNDTCKYGAVGLHYRGPIPKRDDDIAGLAFGYSNFASRLSDIPTSVGGRIGDEAFIETFYRFHVNKWLYLQPDVQFISHPSGMFQNSIAIGLRSVITF